MAAHHYITLLFCYFMAGCLCNSIVTESSITKLLEKQGGQLQTHETRLKAQEELIKEQAELLREQSYQLATLETVVSRLFEVNIIVYKCFEITLIPVKRNWLGTMDLSFLKVYDNI